MGYECFEDPRSNSSRWDDDAPSPDSARSRPVRMTDGQYLLPCFTKHDLVDFDPQFRVDSKHALELERAENSPWCKAGLRLKMHVDGMEPRIGQKWIPAIEDILNKAGALFQKGSREHIDRRKAQQGCNADDVIIIQTAFFESESIEQLRERYCVQPEEVACTIFDQDEGMSDEAYYFETEKHSISVSFMPDCDGFGLSMYDLVKREAIIKCSGPIADDELVIENWKIEPIYCCIGIPLDSFEEEVHAILDHFIEQVSSTELS